MGKRPGRQREFSPVHPNAAAIDIGATMHMAAVDPDRDAEPVRTSGRSPAISTALPTGSLSAG